MEITVLHGDGFGHFFWCGRELERVTRRRRRRRLVLLLGQCVLHELLGGGCDLFVLSWAWFHDKFISLTGLLVILVSRAA